MVKKHLFILLILLINTSIIFAQEINFTAQVSDNVKSGEPFQVAYTLKDARANKFIEPDFENFSRLGRAKSSSSQSAKTWQNGKWVTISMQTTSWLITLVPQKEGKFKIPAATVIIKGKKYKSNTLTINVSKGTNNYYDIQDDDDENVDFGDNPEKLFINLELEKEEAYIGEHISVIATFYSKYENYLEIEDIAVPDYEGFWHNEIAIPQTVKPKQTFYNNIHYASLTFHKKLLIPQKTGKIIIKPYESTCILLDWAGRPDKKIVARSKEKIINIKPLPVKNKPKNFSGAVGDFRIISEIDKTEIKTNQTITIKIVISGNGNFELFDPLKINIHNSFDALDPKETNNYEITSDGIIGRKTYKYTFIARKPGDYTIPAIQFAFFDPQKERYTTLATIPYNIKVNKNDDIDEDMYNTYSSQMEELGKDIYSIKTSNFKLQRKNNFIFGSAIFYLAYLIPIVLFIGIILYRKKQINEKINYKQTISKRANKTSQKKLKKAETFMKMNKQDDFYEEITNALWDFVSDKFSIPSSELTRENITEILLTKNIEQTTINNFIDIINKCEFVRYAPATTDISMQSIFEASNEIIKTMEI